MVVLTLTGFSTGKGGSGKSSSGKSGKSRGGSSSRHSGGGGGCSSSKQNHDSSTSKSDDDYGSGSTSRRRQNYRSTPTPSGSSGSGADLENGTVKLVSCASKQRPYATIEVTNPNAKKVTYRYSVDFQDKSDDTIYYAYEKVAVSAKSTKKLKVQLNDDGSLQDDGALFVVDHCVVGEIAFIED